MQVSRGVAVMIHHMVWKFAHIPFIVNLSMGNRSTNAAYRFGAAVTTHHMFENICIHSHLSRYERGIGTPNARTLFHVAAMSTYWEKFADDPSFDNSEPWVQVLGERLDTHEDYV